MEDIIYLESDEEITTVIDKIKQSKSNNLLLVIPREATILQSVVNLKLLLKEARNLSKEIALVTSDKIGRNLASQVGLVVYESISDRRPIFQPAIPATKSDEIIEIDLREGPVASKSTPKGVSVHHFQEENKPSNRQQTSLATPWKKPVINKNINWPKINKILWPILGFIAILILIGAFLILPIVTLTIKVKAENFQKSEDVQISSKDETNIDSKVFKGQLIELSKDKEEKFPTTGKKNLGGEASGPLTLYNYWDSSPQSLAAGSKFSSSSKTFISKTSISIPGTSIRGGNPVPGTATVDVEAENPGEEYNVKAGRFTIVGLSASQQEKIYGQSNKDFSGGFSKEVNVISQFDYDKAKDSLIKDLTDSLKEDLKQKSIGMEVLDKAIANETVAVNSSSNVDSEASEFTIKISQKLRVIVYQRNALDQFVLNILEKQIPYDKMISLGPGDLIEPVDIGPKYDEQSLNLKVNTTAKVSSRTDTNKIKNDLLGKNNQALTDYLNNVSGISGYTINYKPNFWLKRIPNYKKSFKVELEYVKDEAIPEPSPSISASSTITTSPSVLENQL
ncbi:MAG: hypothetical protein HW405_35 [Candidatus Berkelbacteria bacterium]|nr:hypothetical protein [Candidatus Berkelbacteria bacterium]